MQCDNYFKYAVFNTIYYCKKQLAWDLTARQIMRYSLVDNCERTCYVRSISSLTYAHNAVWNISLSIFDNDEHHTRMRIHSVATRRFILLYWPPPLLQLCYLLSLFNCLRAILVTPIVNSSQSYYSVAVLSLITWII